MIDIHYEFSVPLAWLLTVIVIAAARTVRLGGVIIGISKTTNAGKFSEISAAIG